MSANLKLDIMDAADVYVKQYPYIDDNGIWMPIGDYAPQGVSNHRLVMPKEMFVEAYNKWINKKTVRHGRWEDAPYTYFGAKRYVCSECKDDDFWKKRYVEIKENYCPNCGAKMDGGAEDGNT